MSDDDNSREMSRLWRVWRTAKQMLYDRVGRHATIQPRQSTDSEVQGYELTEEECNTSLDEFRDMFADAHGAPR